MAKRWRFWECFQGEDREQKAQAEIDYLKTKGYPAKIWAPLPQHKTSGHTHVVFLISREDLYAMIDRWRDEVAKND